MKASNLFVRCLEAENVTHIFGIPGEENADMMISLNDSPIDFVLCRHEQAAAFMADVFGRLTGRSGVCLATLGPGATNLVTGIADANMDRAPLVGIIGQASTNRLHKESHQNMVGGHVPPDLQVGRNRQQPTEHSRDGAQGLQAGRSREARRLRVGAARGPGRARHQLGPLAALQVSARRGRPQGRGSARSTGRCKAAKDTVPSRLTPGRARARSSDAHDLARVHDVVGVDGPLQRAHDAYRFAMLGDQKVELAGADAVLSGARPVHRQRPHH